MECRSLLASHREHTPRAEKQTTRNKNKSIPYYDTNHTQHNKTKQHNTTQKKTKHNKKKNGELANLKTLNASVFLVFYIVALVASQKEVGAASMRSCQNAECQ
jgi:hypothetical protein